VVALPPAVSFSDAAVAIAAIANTRACSKRSVMVFDMLQ
jgi:hypothetical protein